MAVEIPVVIDIDKAFADAAKRVSQAIKPLQDQISKHQLNLQVNIGTKNNPQLVKFKDLLSDSQASATQLSRAIKSVNTQISALSKAGGFNPTKGLKASEKDLLALRAALETKLSAGNFIDNATSKIKSLAMESRAAGKEATRAIGGVNTGLRTQGGLWKMLTGYLTAYTAVFAGLRLIKNIRNVTAEFEMQKVALGGIIQDATRANQLFSEIKAAAVQSPFEIKDLVRFTKELSAYRIETDKLFDVTMRLADVSAGLGVDMRRLTLAYGQVRAASVLRGQELRQFTEAGIPLVDLLAKKFSQLRGEMVSTGEVFELISERAVPFKMIEEIFNDMTDAGGIFYQMQLKQSETLKGQWMKLKDVISIAYDEMGRSTAVNAAMKGEIQLLSRIIKEWERIASVLNVVIYSFLSYRTAVRGLIPLYNLQQKSIARQIKLEKQQQIEQIRLASKTNALTKADQRRVAQIKKMNAEDIKRIYSMNRLSAAQATMLFWRNRDNKEIAKAIQQTGLLTKSQMSAIKSMSWMEVRIKTWGSSIRTAFAKIGTAVASFWPIAALSAVTTTIMGLVSAHAAQAEAVRNVDKAYDEQEHVLITIENAYRKIQKAISDTTDEQERATKEAESFGQKLSYAQKVVESLKKFGLGGDFDLSLLNTENIDDFVEKWLEQLNLANELTRDWGRNVAQVANAWEASVLGIHLAGDNLTTDIKQLTNAYVKMTGNKKYRQNVEEMRSFIDYLALNNKEYYDQISAALKMDAALAIQQKRRNETEYEYQMRLIHNYETVRHIAQADDNIIKGRAKVFEPMYDALTSFESKLSEVESEFDKTWGAMEGKDEITIKMAIDKIFAENQWEDWLKEAWIERVNEKYQMNLTINPTIGQINVPSGMKGILKAEFENLFTEQELENMSSVTEIGKAIDEKMKKAADSMEDADRIANNFANNELWSSKTKEKIKKAQIAINEELAKDEKDRNRDAINEAIAMIDALTQQNGVYDQQIVKKKEAAKAEYELAKAAKERLLNEGLSDIGRDIKAAFPAVLSSNEIIDRMNLKEIGEKMRAAFPDASADLLARPLVDAAELVKKGWEEAGDGIATVFTSTFDYEDETGKHNILVTPILPDGTILSPSELDEYVGEILAASDILGADKSKLVIGIDVDEDAGQRLHDMQDTYYQLAERLKNTSNKFLISDEDLKKIKDGGDAYDVWAKNMKAITDEREKMAGAGMSEAAVAEEQARLDAQRLVTVEQIADIDSKIAGFNYEEAKAKYDSLRLAVLNATTARERKTAEKELAEYVEQTNFAEMAGLVIEKKRLGVLLNETNLALGAKQAILDYFDVLDDAEKLWTEFGKRYNFTLKDKPKGGTGEDPWIILYKNRMKFMQDFQKGVEDLDKYLEHPRSLEKEQEFMKGRGLSVGIKTEELLGTPEELKAWYDKTIKEVVAKIRSMGGKEFAGIGVQEILAKDLTGRKIKKYQDLLQELWKGFTDFETSDLKKKIEKQLKDASEELKRSEAARNFYKEILDLTGDENIAENLSVSIYGDPGSEIGDRIKKNIEDTMKMLEIGEDSDLGKKLLGAADTLDFSALLSDIESLPKELQNAIREASSIIEKYNKDTATSYVRLLMQFDEITQKRKTIEQKADEEIATLRRGLEIELKAIDEDIDKAQETEEGKAASERVNAAIEAIDRRRKLELLQNSRDYRLFFNSVGSISIEVARAIAKKQKEILDQQLRNQEITFAQYDRELSKLEKRLQEYESDRGPIVTYLTKGFEGLFDKLDAEAKKLSAMSGEFKDDEGKFSIPEGLEKAVNALSKIFGGGLFGVAGRKNVFDRLTQDLGENQEKWGETMNNASNQLAAMSKDFAVGLGWADFWVSLVGGGIKAFDKLADYGRDSAGEVKKGWNWLAKAVFFTGAGPIPGLGWFVNKKLFTDDMDDAWDRFASMNEHAMEGFEKFKKGDFIGSLVDNIIAWSEVLGKNTKKIDREIKDEADLLEDLEYSYKRVEVAIQDAFGSDYIANYNKQLEILQSKMEAYARQAELEESKGKKKDAEKVEEYRKQAREVSDQILDMQGQLAEFFSGTDLTSAATDFANAWIDAYKEFGSTTDAMREKFNDMLQNMVTNSLAARVMQNILQPLFDEIDTMAKDGELSASEIAQIAQASPEYIEKINNAMTALMNQLTAAGYNIRQQPGQFTGIKRNIANATEESVNGLTQAMNVNNFYMSHIPGLAANVAQILAIMSGGNAEGANTTASLTFSNELAMQYLSALPNIDQNISEILRYVKSVVSDKSSATNINVVAVRA